VTRAAAVLAAALVLAGCPIPQPLPDYPPGTVTPPRILVDELAGDAAVILVPASCTTVEPVYPLSARVVDTNTIETIDTRWFVNYDPRFELNYVPRQDAPVQPDPDPAVLTRTVPTFPFRPYQYPAPPDLLCDPPDPGPPYRNPGVLRVVELVVSNGFDPDAVTTPSPMPYRTPLAGFETQVHRWVFVTVPESPAVPCPSP
jgi:hypothetical protein